MSTLLFIQPLDVLFLRGNKLFGDAGSFGESLVPPWPSVAAGAIRSALLVHKGHDPVRFGRGESWDDLELGTPSQPGSFRLTAFHLARRHENGMIEPLFALPADLMIGRLEDGEVEIRRLEPHRPAGAIGSSAKTEFLAILPQKQRSKPVTGMWLTAEGWNVHLQGKSLQSSRHLLTGKSLWRLDTRVGVGLDAARRTAQEGKLFTVQAVAPRRREHGSIEREDGSPEEEVGFDVGFLAAVSGADLPEGLTLRLGGDGRAALAQKVDVKVPQPDFEAIAKAKRCRLILTTPGLFPDGWLPAGTRADGEDLRFELHGVRGRLVCAAVPRAEIVSGFDLAEWHPKPAQRVAPTGSVYWLEELEATPHGLRKLAEQGLWADSDENSTRRAEGFNCCALAAY